MMYRVESSVTISRPVEEVFRFFLDFDQNAAKMEPNVEAVVKVPEGPTRPGTTFRLQQTLFGKTREATVTFVSFELNRKIEIEARLGPFRPSGPITFEQANRGTRVVLRHNPNPVGPLKLLSPVFARIAQKVWDQRLARLKAVMESSTREG